MNDDQEIISSRGELDKDFEELAIEQTKLLEYARTIMETRDLHSVYEALDKLKKERDELKAGLLHILEVLKDILGQEEESEE